MRTTITVGKTHKGQWVLLGTPDVPLQEQWKKFRSLLGTKADETMAFVQIQDSDGHERHIHLMTPEAHEDHVELRAKEMAEAVAQSKKDAARDPRKVLAELDAERIERNQKITDDLGKPPVETGSEEEVKTEVPQAPIVDASGLRTDGPTLEEWVANGMDPKNYPPSGFAAKQAAATTMTANNPS